MSLTSTITDDEINLLSVGIDIGSSTSHLVFSMITLMRDERTYSRRFYVADRKILYSSDIIDTPLLDKETIDIEKLVAFFRGEYEKAKINKKEVQSGVVIVTGETAKKKNADEIVHLMADDAGSFVAATAGPNFESVIAAFGSGATVKSESTDSAVISCDIGGGTSNIAVSVKGKVISTSCISVGGRLIGFDEEGKINRIDQPARHVMDYLGMTYQIGDQLEEEDIIRICEVFADALIDELNGLETTEIRKKLLMTEKIEVPGGNILYTFSGGVAEMIYNNEKKNFHDIGYHLGQVIKSKFSQLKGEIFEPENKIRATVIGAGSYTLQVSGSTCFLDDDLEYPIRNIPVIDVNVTRENLTLEHVVTEIQKSFNKFDVEQGQDVFALSFEDPVRAAYQQLKLFATGIETALKTTIDAGLPIILIFKRDIGNSVGNVIRRETSIKQNLVSLDEIEVKEGDWIDIGAPLINGQVVPVTVKSLVFSKDT